MDQREYERSMLLILMAGVLVAIIEFLVMAFIVNKPNIVGFQNALIAAGGVMAVVVVVLWAAAALFRPEEDVAGGSPVSPGSSPDSGEP